MKKFIGCILALSMILSSVCVPTMAEDVETSSYEPTKTEALFMNLGIIDKDGYNGNDGMTRADFAVMLAKTLKLDIAVEDETTSLPAVEDSEIIMPKVTSFRDVDTSDAEYGAIMAVNKKGYMVGVSKDLFAPEYNIVLSDAVKVFVDILGYKNYVASLGGYPTGYLQIATELGLDEGISCEFYSAATKKDIAELLYNVMRTPVSKLQLTEDGNASFTMSDDKTFMTEVVGMAKIQGTISDNGLTALNGPSAIDVDEILCGDMILKLPDGASNARKYLGREVVAYIDIRDELEHKLIYAEPVDEAIVISEKNFESFNKGILKYYSENGVLKTANIGTYKGIIYNWVYTTSYTEDYYDVSDGQITLIKNGNDYTVIIENYADMVVAKTQPDYREIHNKLYFTDSQKGLNSVVLDDFEDVCILDDAGNAVDFSYIKKGDVLSVLTTSTLKYAEVIISRKRFENIKVNGINGEEYETDEGIFSISDITKDATNLDPIRMGKYYTFYFSSFGTLVWYEEIASEDGYQEGILLKFSRVETDSENAFGVKIYTSNDMVKSYTVNERLKLNTTTVKAENACHISESGTESGILFGLDVIGKPVLFKADGEVIKELITPLGYAEADDGRGWYQITCEYPDGDAGLKHIDAGNGASFGGLLTYDKATCNIYALPTSANLWLNKDKLRINETEFVNHSEYRIEGYSREKNSPWADVLVHRDDASSGVPDARVALLITDISFTINDDLETVTSYTGYEFVQPGTVTKKTYIVAKDAKMVNGMNKTTDESYVDAIGVCDIIRIGKNSKGEINYITMSYDYDKKEVYNISCREQAYTYKGHVMSISDKGFRLFVPGEVSTTLGVVNVKTPSQVESYIKNSSIPSETRAFASMIRAYHSDSNYPVIVVNTSSRKPSFEEISMDEVYSYEETSGKYDTMVVCTHYLGGKMGGVVYR